MRTSEIFLGPPITKNSSRWWVKGEGEGIVHADLRGFFGSVDHEKLLTLVAQRVADGRVLGLIKAMLKAGSYGKGQLFPSERGPPQGGVITPLTQKVILTVWVVGSSVLEQT